MSGVDKVRGAVMAPTGTRIVRLKGRVRTASALLTYALLASPSLAEPVLLHCDLKVVRGNDALCDVLDPGFCQVRLQIDADLKKIDVLPTTKKGRTTLTTRIDDWSDTRVEFYVKNSLNSALPANADYYSETKATLDRVTGAYVDWWEYRHLNGSAFSRSELADRNASGDWMESMPQFERQGTCKPAKPLF
ncbi:hypothetical protein [Methylibium petroleiphilum]|nr:hypothetical protein [Methylibium petroleiphilum]